MLVLFRVGVMRGEWSIQCMLAFQPKKGKKSAPFMTVFVNFTSKVDKHEKQLDW